MSTPGAASTIASQRGSAKALRMLARRAFYVLPGRWQLHARGLRRMLLRQPDWAGPVRRLRVREGAYLGATAATGRSLGGHKRIAIYSLHHFSSVEYGLAMALQLRGHDVQGVLCDGLLPLCEMSLGPTIRPPCDACILHFARYEDAFGFHYARLTEFISKADRERAEALVAQVPDGDLTELVVDRVPIGRFARRELQRYYRGFVFEPSRDPAYRSWLVAGVLLTWFSARWLDRVQPDIVGLCSGRTLPTACAFEVARQRGVDVVTWDGAATHPDTLVFSHNRPATEVPLDDLWPAVSGQSLTPAQRSELADFMGRWARSENTPFPYNPRPIEDAGEVRRGLGLRPGARVIAAFTNTAWDIAVIDRDVGFDSMFAWLFALVDYAVAHPEIELVVRAHPAEKTVPVDLQSRTLVPSEVRKRYAPLPANVTLIEGDSPISSYTLADLAHTNIVYASRFGLELAMKARRPWIAGAVTYRGKGFTRDLRSTAHMYELLANGGHDDHLSSDEVALAQRFAYLWFFRYEVKLPLLRPPNRRFALESFRDLGPGGSHVLDRLCDRFVTGGAFVDLNG